MNEILFLSEIVESGDLVTLITLIVGLIGSIVALIPTAIKCYKALKELAKNKNWKQIYDLALAAMEEAQKSGKQGAEKKEIVINAVKAACLELNIEINDEQVKELANNIDNLKAWFKDMTQASKEGRKAAKVISSKEEK